MKNHVFLIQAHRYPELLRRILKRLEDSNHFFYINIDSKAKNQDEFKSAISDISGIRQVTHRNIIHGGFSQIDCTVSQLRDSYQDELNFAYFHSISGQDYPCVSNGEFDSVFENGDKSYMLCDTESEALERRVGPYVERLEHWYFMDVFNGPIARKLHVPGILKLLLWPIHRPLKFMDRIYGGWNWFSLSRKSIDYLLDYLQSHKDYLDRFKYTFCTDEIVYSTVLRPVREQLNIETRNSLRFVEWYPKRPAKQLPLTLEASEYQDIVHSNALFCRKVAIPESLELMNLIDEKCLGN